MSGDDAHISFEALVDLAEDRLPATYVAAVRAHVAVCRSCSENLAWIEATTGLMRTDEMEDAPVYVVAQAVRALRDHAPAVPTAPEPAGVFQRIRAMLEFDSGTMAPAAELRSGQTLTRQVLFSAGDHDIDLRVTRVGDRWEVSGQVLGDCEAGTVRLAGGDLEVEADIDDLCEFRLQPVPAGVYTLFAQFSGLDVEVPDLTIGEGRGSS